MALWASATADARHKPEMETAQTTRRLQANNTSCMDCSQLEGRDEGQPGTAVFSRRLFHVDLVEDAAVLEVRLLCLLPTAEHLVDGDDLHVHELLGMLGEHGGVARPVVVLGGDLL